jgi:hypothetical protein
MSLPRMRSIRQALEMIKAEDPNSCLTSYYIRDLCKKNKVRHIKSGTKVMVDYDDLLKFINEME